MPFLIAKTNTQAVGRSCEIFWNHEVISDNLGKQEVILVLGGVNFAEEAS